jgi:Cu(I)/Ag(I) efflux system membrane fusion protein
MEYMNKQGDRWNIKRALPAVLLLAVGMFLGWLFFAGAGSDAAADGHAHGAETASTIWTCSMHPQIRQQEPGMCPICAMELIPLDPDAAADSPDRLQMTEEAVQAASIRTSVVERGMPFQVIRLSGKVHADESRRAEISARVSGRIEKLYVNVTGQYVRAGERVASVYSPELVSAQKELLEALKMQSSNPSYLDAARRKLRYWDFSEEQIRRIEESGQVQRTMDVIAPGGGTVLARMVSDGDYVSQGQSLFAIADLSRVWVLFDAYENDLAWLRKGSIIRLTLAGVTGREFSAPITFIDPVIDASTRVARVRVELPNPDGTLKPEMFASGVVKSMLPGKGDHLVIPKSAVLWTGTRSVTWVRDMEADAPSFMFREIQLGAQTGDFYVVESGLVEGEHVVTQGAFTIDAAAQLQGKVSMMNPAGGPMSSGHDHGETAAAGTSAKVTSTAPSAFRREMHRLFKSYEKISEALIASDASAVPGPVAALRKQVAAVDAGELSGELRIHWAEVMTQLRARLDALQATRDLEKQRAAYALLGQTLQNALKDFGVEGEPVYLAFCPMAFDDKGAYWLTSSKQIRNPYFGDAMLKCGVIKGEIGK